MASRTDGNSVSTFSSGGGTSFASDGSQTSTNGGAPVKITGTGSIHPAIPVFPSFPKIPYIPAFPSRPVANQQTGPTYYK